MDLDRNAPGFFSELRNQLRKVVSNYVYSITEKDPMIIPVVVQM
jgi:mRNA degradation ribonuclease J1/J2